MWAGNITAMTTARLTALLLLLAAPALGAEPAGRMPAPPRPVGYPFAAIHNTEELLARLMCGWCAGLPGCPRYNGSHVHAGVDLRATLGEAVCAIMDGVVDPRSDTPHSGYGPGWTMGQVMIVRTTLPPTPDDPAGVSFLIVYGHTQKHTVKGGDAVRAGQQLCEIGPWPDREGGPHLHVTVRLGDLPRYGWGTPTLQGHPVREGAEVVACEEDVVRLGYREPLAALWGIMPAVTISLP